MWCGCRNHHDVQQLASSSAWELRIRNIIEASGIQWYSSTCCSQPDDLWSVIHSCFPHYCSASLCAQMKVHQVSTWSQFSCHYHLDPWKCQFKKAHMFQKEVKKAWIQSYALFLHSQRISPVNWHHVNVIGTSSFILTHRFVDSWVMYHMLTDRWIQCCGFMTIYNPLVIISHHLAACIGLSK